MRHFLQYWKSKQADENRGSSLGHSASAQLGRVSAGDVLWIVTIRGYHLTLLGRLFVAKVVSQREANQHFKNEESYEAPFHVLAQHTIAQIRELDVQDLASQLRFNSDRDRLTFARTDRTNGRQLQSLRELTMASVALLEARWNEQARAVTRNPSWSRDELILALDTYFQNNPSHINKDNPAILELSATLNKLGDRLGKKLSPDFRNANGTYMKLCNFLHLDPAYQGTGLSSVSAMDRAVWKIIRTPKTNYVHWRLRFVQLWIRQKS